LHIIGVRARGSGRKGSAGTLSFLSREGDLHRGSMVLNSSDSPLDVVLAYSRVAIGLELVGLAINIDVTSLSTEWFLAIVGIRA
jgi:hypothetical protein